MKQCDCSDTSMEVDENHSEHSSDNKHGTRRTYKGQTLGRGVSSILGFIPTEVVFARIIPSSGWKIFSSARGIASPPTLLASSLAFSGSRKKH